MHFIIIIQEISCFIAYVTFLKHIFNSLDICKKKITNHHILQPMRIRLKSQFH